MSVSRTWMTMEQLNSPTIDRWIPSTLVASGQWLADLIIAVRRLENT